MPRKRHRPGTLLATSILSWRPASSIVVTLAARCKSARAPCRARRRRRGALGAAPSNQPGTSLRSTGPGVPAGQQINRRPEPGRRAHVSRANDGSPVVCGGWRCVGSVGAWAGIEAAGRPAGRPADRQGVGVGAIRISLASKGSAAEASP
jgi:hypothetical protein